MIRGHLPADPAQKRNLGTDAASPVGVSYNTAWLCKHKLMHAMISRDSDLALGGIVQLDDAYRDGERHGSVFRALARMSLHLLALLVTSMLVVFLHAAAPYMVRGDFQFVISAIVVRRAHVFAHRTCCT